MRRWIGLSLALSLAAAPVALAQQPWKPDVKFIKFGVATAGGDWFRAGAKYTTLVPEALPGVSATTLMGGGVVNVTKVAKGEAQIAFALTPSPEEGYHGKGPFKEPLKNVRLVASNLGRTVVIGLFVALLWRYAQATWYVGLPLSESALWRSRLPGCNGRSRLPTSGISNNGTDSWH